MSRTAGWCKKSELNPVFGTLGTRWARKSCKIPNVRLVPVYVQIYRVQYAVHIW